jgi:mitochondrial fission protein ELM1
MTSSFDSPMRLWLIDTGIPGHTVQVAGLGRILEDQSGAVGEWIHCRLRVRGILRGVARTATRHAPAVLARLLARCCYRDLVLPTGRPDVIIASSGDSAYLARLLGRLTGAVTVFIGEVQPFPPEWFDLVVLPTDSALKNAITVPLMETGQTPERAAAAAVAFWPRGTPGNCWSVLIGGSSRSHRFTAEDWRAMAIAMNRLAHAHGIRWLLTTSRRTGKEAEDIMRATLEPSVIKEAIWWLDAPKKAVAAFLHAGERVFVTRDSLTMISEAIAVKGQAVVVVPAECRISRGSMMDEYLGRLELQGRIQPFRVDALESLDVPAKLPPMSESLTAFSVAFSQRIRNLLDAKERH